MDTNDFYRVTHYDPARWVHEYVQHKCKTLKEAKERAEILIKEFIGQICRLI